MKYLKEPVEVLLEIKKSKFFCYLFSINNEEDVASHRLSIKKQHPKANHHCVAYVIKENNILRFDDDNEPQHTAGKPMLHVLEQQDVDRILAIVVRYFGGVKLGRGGLVKAYTQSVTTALNAAQFVEPVVKYEVSFIAPFEISPAIEAYLYHIEAIVQTQYQEHDVLFTCIMDTINNVEQKLEDLSKGAISNFQVSSFLE